MARASTLIVLLFACVWLWVGVSGLRAPWQALVAAAGGLGLLVAGWHALRRAPSAGRSSGFDRRRYLITVLLEVAALNLVGWQLARAGLSGYLWPAIGIVVALHFIGMWWASADRRFLALTAAMLIVNLVALVFPPNGAAMLAVAGLGSAAALTAAMVRG